MANPTKSSGKDANVGKGKREIPDPAAFMQQAMNAPSGFPNPSTPGQTGQDFPTKGDSATSGFASVNSHGGSQVGSKEMGNKAKGTGKTQSKVSPNNKKHAGPMIKGKNPHMPSKAAIARKLDHHPVGTSKAPSATSAQGRTGVLSRFEGFNGNKS